MRKLILLSAICLLFSGCSDEKETQHKSHTKEEVKEKKQETKNETGEASADDKNEKQVQNTETTVENEQEKDNAGTNTVEGPFLDYRPESNLEKEFTENGVVSFKEQVVAQNTDYVQRNLILGEMVTLQILKWSSNEVSVVYEESNPEKPSENKLNSFESLDEPEILLSQKGKSDSEWKIISKNEKVKVPFGYFENVFVVQRTIKEGQEAIHTTFYAPKVGLIKEVYEVKGDNGYKVETVLSKVNKL